MMHKAWSSIEWYPITFQGHLSNFKVTLQWHHNWRDGISNHKRLDCLLNRLFRLRSQKHQSSASLAFVRGIHWGPVNSRHKGPVTRKMFPFDDVIMHTGQKIADFGLNLVLPDCNSSLDSPMVSKWCTELDIVKKRCPVIFQGHQLNFKVAWANNFWFWPKLSVSGL